MAHSFVTKIDSAPNNTRYLKVYLLSDKGIDSVKEMLDSLSSVSKVNIGNKRDLTVQPHPTYTVEEMQQEVERSLNTYFSASDFLLEGLDATSKSLQRFSRAKSLFDRGVMKYKQSTDDRSCLDDFRLAIELLLKEVLHNEKSLENQKDCLGCYLEDKGISKELKNFLILSIGLYEKYQNEHVKHNEAITKFDTPVVLNATKNFIEQIIVLEGGEI